MQTHTQTMDGIHQKLATITSIIVQEATPDKIILLSPINKVPQYTKSRITFLVLTTEIRQGRTKLQTHIEKCCHKMAVPVNIFIHHVHQFNIKLADTPYLFPEANFEGDFIYDASGIPLTGRPVVDKESIINQVQGYFNTWFTMAQAFYRSAIFSIQRKEFHVTVLLMYQAIASAYTGMLLVFTGYKPDTSDLRKLYNYTSSFSAHLANLRPESIERSHPFFNRLNTAYSDFHKNKFAITKDDCALLTGRVGNVLKVAKRICRDRIKELEN